MAILPLLARKKGTILNLLAVAACLELVYLLFTWSNGQAAPSASENFRAHNEHLELQTSLREFLQSIRQQHPSLGYGKVPKLDKWDYLIDDYIEKMQKGNDPITIDVMSKFLRVPEEQKQVLKEQHSNVVSKLPNLPHNSLSGRGIVMTGGGSLFGQALVAVKYFNEFFPGVPIELWMTEDEYEPEYCSNLFPTLNATCLIVENVFGQENLKGFEYKGYPLKALALAGSRFEEIYFTDVDSLPLLQLQYLFESTPFKETGLVVFPDYWIRVTAPDYYEIAGVLDADTPKSTPMTAIKGAVPDKMSSESGQMILNKKQHWKSLLLALYYNLNGENYYYPLLCQKHGIAGFGDKETFYSAASVLGEKVYQIQDGVGTLGYHTPDGYHGSAILQLDPQQDYEKYKLGQSIKPQAAILHANNMKMDPYILFNPDESTDSWARPNVRFFKRRLLGPVDGVKQGLHGRDVELLFFEIVQHVVCDWIVDQHMHPRGAPKSATSSSDKDLCKAAVAHVEWLKNNDGADPK